MQKKNPLKLPVLILSYIVAVETILLVILCAKVWKKPAGPPSPLAKAKIAIVIDDWGYNLNNLGVAGQINYPFTAAILPNLSHSREVAEQLHSLGIEIILHLPMEPREKYRLEKNTIMTSSSGAAIEKVIDADLTNIVYARGISNHMGSRATEHRKTMENVFNVLKKRRLFFLDSFVTPRTVCSSLAKKMGVVLTRRDIFLDNKEDPAYIKEQVNKLKSRAKTKGAAVGIGHDRKVTLEVLKEAAPQLEKEGFKLVFVSELAT